MRVRLPGLGSKSRLSLIGTAAGIAAGALVLAGVVPANASVPATLISPPTVAGMTGSRTSATPLTFPISDAVSASVDVGTGNLEVSTHAFNLQGVTGQVSLGATFNSMSQLTGSTTTQTANKWIIGAAGAGALAAQPSTGDVFYYGSDGSVWEFTPVSGSTTAYTTPPGLQATLVGTVSGNTTTGWKLTASSSQQVTAFAANGNPTSITDRNGNVTNLTYNSSGALATVVSTAGPSQARTATYSYNQSYNQLTLSQQGGYQVSRSAAYQLDSSNNLDSYQDADGNTTNFTYTSGQLTKIVSTIGGETDFTYDSSGRVTEVDQHNTTSGSPGTSTTRLAYPSSTQTLVANPNTSTASPVASVPHITYTIGSDYLVTQSVDQDGRQRGANYTGNLTTNLQPSSTTSGNTSQNPPANSTPVGTTDYSFGANSGQSLTSVQSPGGATTSWAYGNSNPSQAYLPTSSTSSAGVQSTYSYNGAGNMLSSENNATAATATLGYNTNGTVSSATAPNNAAAGSTPANPTTYTYNTNYQLVTITPPTGTSLHAQTFTYDGYGRVSTVTDGNGHTTTYSYDNMDRVTGLSYSDGTHAVTSTYDKAGELLTQASASGTVTNTYDQLGHLLSTVNTAGGGTESYTYDLAGNLLTTTDGFGTVTNTWDSANTIEYTKYPHAGGYQYMYYTTDDQGRRTDEYLQSNPAENVWTGHVHTNYDSSGRITEIIAQTGNGTNASGNTTVFDTKYCYTANTTAPNCTTSTSGDRQQLQWAYNVETGTTTTYGYDSSGRLHSVSNTGTASGLNSYVYGYDNDGNRTSVTVNGGTPTTFTYNPANQITNTGYSYDAAGNLTASPSPTGTGSATYTYNGAQQMTQSVVNGTTTNYTYAGGSQNEILSETSSSMTTNIVYGRTDATGQPEIEQYKVNSGQAYVVSDPTTGQAMMPVTSSDQDCLLVYDGLDNPVALLTDFGQNAFSYQYDPWGVQTLTSGGTGNGASQNPYTFHSGIKDTNSGLVHFGARWYDPQTGTWTQQDTLDQPLNPANANRYAYAGDDPINNLDPTGESTAALLIGGTAGVLAGLAVGVALGSVCAVTILVGCAIAGFFALVASSIVAKVTADDVDGEPVTQQQLSTLT